MDLFYIIVLTLILIETSVLLFSKSFTKPSKRFAQSTRRKVFVDTSTLMDGRILSIAKAGFLSDEVLIPRSVVRELQLLADGSDSEKRARARFGLDVVNELERVENADVEVFIDSDEREKVDDRLIKLAKAHHGVIFTNDFNLMKVASTEKVDSINVNELAQGLRSEYLPGDKLIVKIISVGSNPRQGIAYLPDGTMVVVDDAERLAGKSQGVEVEFVRFLQTNAGKMMFAKLTKKPATSARRTRTSKESRDNPKCNNTSSRDRRK